MWVARVPGSRRCRAGRSVTLAAAPVWSRRAAARTSPASRLGRGGRSGGRGRRRGGVDPGLGGGAGVVRRPVRGCAPTGGTEGQPSGGGDGELVGETVGETARRAVTPRPGREDGRWGEEPDRRGGTDFSLTYS